MPKPECRTRFRTSSFVILSDFELRHSDFSSSLAFHLTRKKIDPADAHQRGQFHETHGLGAVASDRWPMPSRVAWQLAADQRAFLTSSSARRCLAPSPSQPNSYENAASHRGWLGRSAVRTRSSDCGGT